MVSYRSLDRSNIHAGIQASNGSIITFFLENPLLPTLVRITRSQKIVISTFETPLISSELPSASESLLPIRLKNNYMQQFVRLWQEQIDPLPLEAFHGMFGALAAWNKSLYPLSHPLFDFFNIHCCQHGNPPRVTRWVCPIIATITHRGKTWKLLGVNFLFNSFF